MVVSEDNLTAATLIVRPSLAPSVPSLTLVSSLQSSSLAILPMG